MPVEPITNPNWMSLRGRVLEGGYELQDVLKADESTAVFKVRVLGAPEMQVVVSFFRAPTAAAAGEQVNLWQTAQGLKHANVNAPIASGQLQSDGIDLAYLISNRADEALDTVLRDRALNASETGEMLLSVLRALNLVHGQGLVHGCIAPEEITAQGDAIQLSAECVRHAGVRPPLEVTKAKYRAPESKADNLTPAADVWCLGATLFEALTQKEYNEPLRNQAVKFAAPFGAILDRCLHPDPQSRCKLPDILALYKGQQTESAAPAVAERPKAAAATVGGGSRAMPSGPRRDVPPAPRKDIPTVVRRDAPFPAQAEPLSKPRRIPLIWIWTGLGLAIILSLIWWARPKNAARTVNAPVAKAPRINRPQSAAQSHVVQPAAPVASSTLANIPSKKAAPKEQITRSTPSEGKSINGNIWRVVLYTYNRQGDAENKAKLINEKHPNLHAEAFTPNGQGPYLVVIGGQMDRASAVALRRQAREMGMPRDTYIQNFAR